MIAFTLLVDAAVRVYYKEISSLLVYLLSMILSLGNAIDPDRQIDLYCDRIAF